MIYLHALQRSFIFTLHVQLYFFLLFFTLFSKFTLLLYFLFERKRRPQSLHFVLRTSGTVADIMTFSLNFAWLGATSRGFSNNVFRLIWRALAFFYNVTASVCAFERCSVCFAARRACCLSFNEAM